METKIYIDDIVGLRSLNTSDKEVIVDYYILKKDISAVKQIVSNGIGIDLSNVDDHATLSVILLENFSRVFSVNEIGHDLEIVYCRLDYSIDMRSFMDQDDNLVRLPKGIINYFDIFFCHLTREYFFHRYHNTVYVNGIGYCEVSAVDERCETQGYYYCERSDEYYTSYDAYRQENGIDEYLMRYHSGRSENSKNVKSENARFYVGFEIEKEDQEILESITLDRFMKLHSEWRKERDGSLCEESGFELISPIYPLAEGTVTEIIEDCMPLEDHIDAEWSSNCGFHVHVSDRHRTNVELYNHFENWLPMLYALYPSRRNNNYSYAKNKGDNPEYRGAIHLKAYGLEIRLFPALRNMDQLKWRLNLVRYMAEHRINSAKDMARLFKCSKFKRLLISIYGNNHVRMHELMRRCWEYSIQYKFITQDEYNELQKAS